MLGRFHIPSLDGLRAVAVLIVFVGHGELMPSIWPGHVGVTIFFFLSGFLITTLLRRELDGFGAISLKNFYLRRFLRITPPALFSIALCVLAGILLIPSTMNIWGVLSEVLNYTNYYMIYVNGHDGLPPESSMLWSLAVEEHFYLIFPALFIGLTALGLTYRRIGYVLIALSLLAPLWRLYLYLDGASFYRLYTSTDTRYDGLLFGAAMALLWNPALGDKPPFSWSGDTISRLIVPASLVVFALLSIFPDPHRLTVIDPFLYICLIPIFWAFITRPDGWMGKILNHPLAIHVGMLSFSLYLVHRIVIKIVSIYVDNSLMIDVLALMISLIVAQAMYFMIEKPCAMLRKRLETRRQRSEKKKMLAISESAN